MTTTSADVRQWLDSHIESIQWQGDQGEARCPLHEDSRASLSVNAEKAVWICHAGCGDGHLYELAKKQGWPWPFSNGDRRREVERYQYQDAAGHVAYEVVRFEPKDFRIYNPNTREWNAKGIPRVPYRLPELLQGIEKGRHVLIPEGEKDVDRLRSLGFLATCNPGGCGSKKLWHQFSSYFPAGVNVDLIPDADKPGHELMCLAAGLLSVRGCVVRWIDLSYPITEAHGKDVSDWLAEGHNADELKRKIEATAQWRPAADNGGNDPAKDQAGETGQSDQGEEIESADDAEEEDQGEQASGEQSAGDENSGTRRGPSQGTRLVELAIAEGMEFFHDDRRLYVGLVVGNHKETWPLRSVSFRDLLSHLYFLHYGKSPGGTALEDAIKTLSGKAQFEGQWEEVYVRVAGNDSRIVLDLANDSWEAIEITAEGWKPVADPGVRFRRTKGMAPLPTPVHGGNLSDLYSFLNTKTPEDLLLVLS